MADTATVATEAPISDFEATVAKMKSGDSSMFTKAPVTDETTPASSAEETKAEVEPKAEPKPVVKEPADKAAALEAKIAGLEKELARRTEQKKETGEEVSTLRERLAKLEGQLEEQEKQRKAQSTTKSVKDFSVEDLIALETDWDEALADAKAAGDADRVARAKANKNAIKTELQHRAAEAGVAKNKAVTEEDTLKTELTAIYEDAYTAFPELKEKDSDLWKAAQAQYSKLPKRFQESGVVGDMMAVVRAIAKDPKLLGKRETKARQEVLSNLEKAADKAALTTGASSTNTKTIPDFAALPSDDINAMAERMKRGKPLL